MEEEEISLRISHQHHQSPGCVCVSVHHQSPGCVCVRASSVTWMCVCPCRSESVSLSLYLCQVFDLMENLCLDVFTRHDDEPTVTHDVCTHMWEEDEDEIIDAVIKHKDEAAVAKALCVDKFNFCSKVSSLQVAKAHDEL